MKKILCRLLASIVSLIRIGIVVFIFLILAGFVISLVDNPTQYPTLMKVTNLEQQVSAPVIKQIKMFVPYKFQGVDYSQLILFGLLLLLAHICSVISSKLRMIMYYEQHASKTVSREKITQRDNNFEVLNTGKTGDRKKILKEFATLKSKLDNMGQQLAFLAIDVVDSTGMKRDEDKHLITYDFDRYNQVVDACLKDGGVVKYAMTPDGIMSCFRTVDDAVNTAVALLEKLKIFNLHEKQIKRSFQIRCGISAGFVYIDDETPLEQVSDRVIDIAGHMQKYAKPDSINIAASAIEPLKNRGGFSETMDVIDEQKVYEWHGKHELK